MDVKAIEWTIMLGLALGCEIPNLSKFDRKNYFYPDLPKGYQISQYDQPLCRSGKLEININRHPDPDKSRGEGSLEDSSPAKQVQNDMMESKTIRINRVHLEEDTGKLLHQTINDKKVTLIDFNRSGVPLVEIVTEPDIHSAEDAKTFLKKLYQIIRYLDISDASMEKGSMRLEPNISVKNIKYQISNIPASPAGRKNTNQKLNIDESYPLPNYKVEVKNINSFNFVKRAIDFEIERHIQILESGETPIQETRGWDEKKGVTIPQRSKEGAADYRYFPEPDIPPMKWTNQLIDDLRLKIKELPDAKINRFVKDFDLPYQAAERLVEDRAMSDYFEAGLKMIDLTLRQSSGQGFKNIKSIDIANWLLNKNVDIKKVRPEDLVKQIVASKNVVQIDNDKLILIIDEVLDVNSKAVTDYKNGKVGVIMFLVGSVMRSLKAKADTQLIKKMLEERMK